ncbi:hypothetical protein J7L48_10310, partial [bacterium]|nr:hypothetical protein [bacterium]
LIVNAGILGLISYFLIFINLLSRGFKFIKNTRYNFIALIFLSTTLIFLMHSLSYDLSVVFKMNAYFYTFAGLITVAENEEKNTF